MPGSRWRARLAKLRSIRADEWVFVGRCLVALARTELQLSLPYSSWRTQLLKATSSRSTTRLERRQLAELRRLVWLFTVAVRLYPRPAACLHRSLTLHTLLTHRGVATQLRIGVRLPDKRPSAGEELGVAAQLGNRAIEAHAWLEYDAEVLYDQVEPRQSYEQMPL